MERSSDWNPRWVRESLITSLTAAFVAVFIVFLHRYARRFGVETEWLFAKEGPFEHLTWIAELAAAVLLMSTARVLWRRSDDVRGAAVAVGVCAVLLFVVAMEEISWGQTLFQFDTPERWAQINHQQETTLHNLLDREALTKSAPWIAWLFASASIFATAIAASARRPWLALLAPPWSLAPMAIVIAFAGWKTHPEVIEVIMALYCLFYSVRTHAVARDPVWQAGAGKSSSNAAPTEGGEPAMTLLKGRSPDLNFGSGADRPMTLLVTGASGFIGSRLVQYARAQGYRVVALGMANTPAECARIQELNEAGIDVRLGDLADRSFLKAAAQGCTAAIHLAAAQHEVNVPDSHFMRVNVEGTRNLLDVCAEAGVRRFVYGSSIGVYGAVGAGVLDESSPMAPDNAYTRSKARAEEVVRSCSSTLEITIVRISEAYGPGDTRLLKLFDAIARSVFVMIGAGDNRRQPIHIADLTRALLMAAHHPRAAGETFVLAGPQVISTREMVDAIARALHRRASIPGLPLRPVVIATRVIEATFRPLGLRPPIHQRRLDFFTKSFAFDVRKAEHVLGFKAQIGFQHGAADAADWYRSRGLLKSELRSAPAAALDPRTVLANGGASDMSLWRYSEILEHTNDAIIVWEMGGEGIVYWNRAAEHLYGYSYGQARGKVTHTLLNTKLSGGIEQLESQLAKLGVWAGQLLHTASDGRKVLVQARLILMAKQNGRWLVLEVNRDTAAMQPIDPQEAISSYLRTLQ